MLILYPITSSQNPSGFVGDVFLFAVIAVLGAAVMFYVFYIRGLSDENAKFQHDYLVVKEIWNKKMIQWEKLYYCYRNDIVFDPEAGKSAPPEQLESLII